MAVQNDRIYYPKELIGYLQDPFLDMLFSDMRVAGQVRASSIDITENCNLRCKGCYFFEGQMDQWKSSIGNFDQFIASELARGTNYFTVLGGEPSLALDRLKKIYDNFKMVVVTNGLIKIPYAGFEYMPIAVSVWGDSETDKIMRGGGKVDVFARALENYKNDERVTWYFTITSGNFDEIVPVTDRCVANGNFVGYNFYGDITGLGGGFDHRNGFHRVRRRIDSMIVKYPERIMNTAYLNQVVSSGRLCDEKWGYDVCSSITFDHEANKNRIRNGHFYNKHFRAYNADLTTTRKCCVGTDRDCSNCFDLWAHYSWIMASMRKHLKTKTEFTNWLTTTYVFFLLNRLVDFKNRIEYLPEIHRRTSASLQFDKKRPANVKTG